MNYFLERLWEDMATLKADVLIIYGHTRPREQEITPAGTSLHRADSMRFAGSSITLTPKKAIIPPKYNKNSKNDLSKIRIISAEHLYLRKMKAISRAIYWITKKNMVNFSSKRQAYAFNKKGDRMSVLDLPEMYYLDTEGEYVRKQLFRVPELDGMAFIIDWEARQLTSVRYAENS